MLPAALRNALIGFGMFILTIVVMFFFPVTREFIIRTAAVFSLTERVCENVQTQGDVIYTIKACREDLNLFGRTYSVSESF
ncbi:MAG: hypothetical protein Q7S79_01700 [bacterium]|nr:hypothetical protein [bacterium]